MEEVKIMFLEEKNILSAENEIYQTVAINMFHRERIFVDSL